MTTPDPSREAFEKWYIEDAQSLNIGLRDWTREELMSAYLERRKSGLYRSESANSEWKVWQAAMAHKGAELEQVHEARRQAQAELADMQEKRNRIGLDIDLALRGEVNEQSPIAGRLKLIAEAGRWQSIETAPRDGSTILACYLQPEYAVPVIVWWSSEDQNWETYSRKSPPVSHWQPLPAAPKQEGST